MCWELELEPALTSGVRECFDSSVIAIVAPIKLDRLDPRRGRFVRDGLSDLGCRLTVAAVADAVPQGLVPRAGAGESFA